MRGGNPLDRYPLAGQRPGTPVDQSTSRPQHPLKHPKSTSFAEGREAHHFPSPDDLRHAHSYGTYGDSGSSSNVDRGNGQRQPGGNWRAFVASGDSSRPHGPGPSPTYRPAQYNQPDFLDESEETTTASATSSTSGTPIQEPQAYHPGMFAASMYQHQQQQMQRLQQQQQQGRGGAAGQRRKSYFAESLVESDRSRPSSLTLTTAAAAAALSSGASQEGSQQGVSHRASPTVVQQRIRTPLQSQGLSRTPGSVGSAEKIPFPSVELPGSRTAHLTAVSASQNSADIGLVDPFESPADPTSPHLIVARQVEEGSHRGDHNLRGEARAGSFDRRPAQATNSGSMGGSGSSFNYRRQQQQQQQQHGSKPSPNVALDETDNFVDLYSPLEHGSPGSQGASPRIQPSRNTLSSSGECSSLDSEDSPVPGGTAGQRPGPFGNDIRTTAQRQPELPSRTPLKRSTTGQFIHTAFDDEESDYEEEEGTSTTASEPDPRLAVRRIPFEAADTTTKKQNRLSAGSTGGGIFTAVSRAFWRSGSALATTTKSLAATVLGIDDVVDDGSEFDPRSASVQAVVDPVSTARITPEPGMGSITPSSPSGRRRSWRRYRNSPEPNANITPPQPGGFDKDNSDVFNSTGSTLDLGVMQDGGANAVGERQTSKPRRRLVPQAIGTKVPVGSKAFDNESSSSPTPTPTPTTRQPLQQPPPSYFYDAYGYRAGAPSTVASLADLRGGSSSGSTPNSARAPPAVMWGYGPQGPTRPASMGASYAGAPYPSFAETDPFTSHNRVMSNQMPGSHFVQGPPGANPPSSYVQMWSDSISGYYPPPQDPSNEESPAMSPRAAAGAVRHPRMSSTGMRDVEEASRKSYNNNSNAVGRVTLLQAIEQYKRFPSDATHSLVLLVLSQRPFDPITPVELMAGVDDNTLLTTLIEKGFIDMSDEENKKIIQARIDREIPVDSEIIQNTQLTFLTSLLSLQCARISREQRGIIRRSGFEFVQVLNESPHVEADIPFPGVFSLEILRLISRRSEPMFLLFGLLAVWYENGALLYLIFKHRDINNIQEGNTTLFVWLGTHFFSFFLARIVFSGRAPRALYGDAVGDFPSIWLKGIPFLPLFDTGCGFMALKHVLRPRRVKNVLIREDLVAMFTNMRILHGVVMSLPMVMLVTYFETIRGPTDRTVDSLATLLYNIAAYVTILGSFPLHLKFVLSSESVNHLGFAMTAEKVTEVQTSENYAVSKWARMISLILFYLLVYTIFLIVIGAIHVGDCSELMIAWLSVNAFIVAGTLALAWQTLKHTANVYRAARWFVVPIVVQFGWNIVVRVVNVDAGNNKGCDFFTELEGVNTVATFVGWGLLIVLVVAWVLVRFVRMYRERRLNEFLPVGRSRRKKRSSVSTPGDAVGSSADGEAEASLHSDSNNDNAPFGGEDDVPSSPTIQIHGSSTPPPSATRQQHGVVDPASDGSHPFGVYNDSGNDQSDGRWNMEGVNAAFV